MSFHTYFGILEAICSYYCCRLSEDVSVILSVILYIVDYIHDVSYSRIDLLLLKPVLSGSYLI